MVLTYVGLMRVYSLVDLLLLTAAARATETEAFGILLIWLASLAHLEYEHAHPNRPPVPAYCAPLFLLVGLVFFQRAEGAIAFVAMYCYSHKHTPRAGLGSPFWRGLFNFFIVAALTGYAHPLPYLAYLLIVFRNILGDARDVIKDRAAGMTTIPMILGLDRDRPRLHLAALGGTTIVWWSLTNLPIVTLLAALAIELLTYRLTPR